MQKDNKQTYFGKKNTPKHDFACCETDPQKIKQNKPHILCSRPRKKVPAHKTRDAARRTTSVIWRKPGKHLGSGVGIVFVVLGGRIWDRNPGVFPARHEPFSLSLIVLERNSAAILPSPSIQHNKSVPTSTCSIGKPSKGYTVPRP